VDPKFGPGIKLMSQIAAEYGIHPQQVRDWRRNVLWYKT